MTTKSSHKKKPTGAKLPKARHAWAQDNEMFAPSKKHFANNPTRAVHRVVFLPMPTLKAAKQAVRFANMSHEQKVEAGARAMSCLPHGKHMTESWWKAYKRDYPSAWRAAITASEHFLALLGHTP